MNKMQNVWLMIVFLGAIGVSMADPLTGPTLAVKKSSASWGMTAGTAIWSGGLVAVSNGIAYPAASNAAYRVVGVADDSAAAGERVTVSQGIYAIANASSGSGTNTVYALDASSAGKICYAVDDACVSSAGICPAGTVVYVETDRKYVWVDIGRAWAGSVTNTVYK